MIKVIVMVINTVIFVVMVMAIVIVMVMAIVIVMVMARLLLVIGVYMNKYTVSVYLIYTLYKLIHYIITHINIIPYI